MDRSPGRIVLVAIDSAMSATARVHQQQSCPVGVVGLAESTSPG